MTSKVIYTCDFCGHQQDGHDVPRVFYFLTFAIRQVNGRYDVQNNLKSKESHACDKCAKDKLLFKRPDLPKDAPQPTLEDMIRDLVTEEVESAMRNRS